MKTLSYVLADLMVDKVDKVEVVEEQTDSEGVMAEIEVPGAGAGEGHQC
jgi:hypothetical protein